MSYQTEKLLEEALVGLDAIKAGITDHVEQMPRIKSVLQTQQERITELYATLEILGRKIDHLEKEIAESRGT